MSKNQRLSWLRLCLVVMLTAGWGCGASADEDFEDPVADSLPSTPEEVGTPDVDAPPASNDDETPWLRADGSIDRDSLHGWLRAGGHRSWTSSSDIIQTPEGGSRVFLNSSLADDRARSEPSLATGAVGIRELYEPDFQTLRAFNVMVKVADEGRDEGMDWMWFEIDAQSPTPSFSVEERGAGVCVGCHGPAPDPLMSPWPLP